MNDKEREQWPHLHKNKTDLNTTMQEIAKLTRERDLLIRRLLKAMDFMSREQQFAALTSQLSMDELRKLVEFQER